MNINEPQRIRVIDSHTGGEPTRVVIDGCDEPLGETIEEKRHYFDKHLDWLRTAVICEPRGHEAIVGAFLCKPTNPDCVAGVIFFNNVGTLNGCLHGTMGVAVTMLHLGLIEIGEHKLETPSGVVSFTISHSGQVRVRNVRSYCYQQDVVIEIPEYGPVKGDIAWGGNWFFLTNPPPQIKIECHNIEKLTHFAWTIRRHLNEAGITGEAGGEIDHIELFGPPSNPEKSDSKNFVLCPGKVYDRSPCGTGTSAKLACLFASSELKENQLWRQAGILDTVFEGYFEMAQEGGILPHVSGSAFITAEAILIIDPSAPFAFGIPGI